MSKDSNSSPDVMPVPQSSEIHPRGLLEAISCIDQNFANELGGCMIKARFLTTKQRLEFMEVGFRSSFASGIVSALLTPVAIGVIEQYIPMFGDPSPTFFDKFCAFLLALGFSLGYAIFMAKASTCFIGEYTRAMVLNLLGGMIFGAIVKAVLAFIAFHFLYFKIFTDKNVLWVVAKLYYAKTSPSTVASVYYWVQGFKGIFLISAYFVLVSTAVFIVIPIVAMLVAYLRNRKLIAAGVVHVDTTVSRIVLTALLLLIPTLALALDMDFYVWGGHDAVVNAFSKLALIFGDNAYKSLYFVVITAGLFFGGVTVFAQVLGSGNGSVMTWLVPTLIGIMVYLALVVPKGTIHVYDPVFNKNQAVGGIPDGVVAVAGILNNIERGLVEIVTTAGDPLNYQTQAGGKGFLGLAQLTSIPLSSIDSNLDASMRRYVKDCVSYALMNPNAALSVDELRKTTTNFVGSLDKAVNPAIWTVYFDAGNPQGQTLTCTDAWTQIKAALTPANLGKNIESVCANLGYDVADSAALNQCKTVLNNVNSGTGLGAASIDDFLRQAYVSQRLEEVFRSGNATGATNYQFLLSASGAMKSANEWLPILKAALTAIAVGLLPFLALFIPTPLIGKAVGIIAGFFIWLTAWGVTDAIVHQFAVDYANRAYEMVRQNKLGMDALYFFPDQTVKILGMFGTLRMSGMMLATVITGMLIKFGGHAMSMMAGSLGGQVQSAGSRGVHDVEDPAGRASAMQRNVTAMPTQAWSNEHSFQARQAQSLVGMSGKTTASSDMIRDFGMNSSNRITADSELGRSIGFGGTGRAMREGGLSSSYDLKSFDGRLGLDKSAAVKDMVSGSYGGDTRAFAKMGVANDRALANVFGSGENYEGFLTANMDKSVGQLQGEMGAYAGAKSLGFEGSWRDFNSMRSEVSALGDFANADAVNKIADTYGISSGQLMQMNSQFQQGKNSSEVAGLSNQLGGPVVAGTEAGRVLATETGGKIQGIYAGGGFDKYQQLTSNDVSGKIARNDLVHSAADQMVGRIAPELKNNPEMYKDGHLTERGFAEMQKAMEGQNINFTTADGKSAVNVGMDGGIVNSSASGTVAKGDKGHALELQKQLKTAGFQSAAGHVGKLSGQAFDYKADYDKNGNLASFAIDQGGRVQKFDLGQSKTGTDNERMDRNVSTVDKGLRQTVGSQSWTGQRAVDEHTNVSMTNQYAQVDRTVATEKDARGINKMLTSSGSSVRVGVGDTVQMRLGPAVAQNMTKDGSLSSHGAQGVIPTVSSFSVKRGGEKDFRDFSHELHGSHKQTYDNRTERTMGVNVEGVGSDFIRAIAGEKAAEVIIGTTNGTVSTIHNVAAVSSFASAGSGAVGKNIGNASGLDKAPSAVPSMNGYTRY